MISSERESVDPVQFRCEPVMSCRVAVAVEVITPLDGAYIHYRRAIRNPKSVVGCELIVGNVAF